MKNMKKVFIPLAAITLVFSLASCDASRNSKVPYGSVSEKLTEAYASSNGFSATYEEVYNKLRQNGYSSFLSELKKSVMADKMEQYSYTKDEYKEEYIEKIMTAIYSVDNVEDYLELTDDEIENYIETYIDTEYSTYGLVLTEEDLKVTANEETNKFEVNFPESLYKQYQYSIMCEKYAYEYIEAHYTDETIINKDGIAEDNSYYIDEDEIETTYNEAFKYYGESKVLVVKFTNKAQAERIVTETNEDVTLTDETKLDYYVELYNNANKDKTQLDPTTVLESDIISYVYDEDTAGLNEISSEVATFVEEELEDGEYLETPRNLDGSYYMIYRISFAETEDYADLSESFTEAEIEEKRNEVLEYLIDSKASESYGDTLVTKRLTNEEVGTEVSFKIYDPIYENQYYNSNTETYEFANEFSNDYIYEVTFTIDSNTRVETLSADTFYAYLDSIHGVTYATDILTEKYLYSLTNMIEGIDEDTYDSYEDTIKDAIKDFKNGNTSYSKKMGVDNYLVLTYGYNTEDACINYNLIASAVESIFSTYYGYFGSESDSTLFDTENALFTKFVKYSTQNRNNFLNLTASHILIQIVDDENTDPDDYIESLPTEELKTAFTNTINRLADAIVKEANYMTSDMIDSLSFIAKTFNNPGYGYTLKCDDYKGMTWEEVKNGTNGEGLAFELSLRAEDLGEITTSSNESYVEEFQDRIKLLYEYYTSTDDLIDAVQDDGVLEHTTEITDEAYTELNELCKTTYGYHIINLYDIEESTSCKYTKDNDSKATDAEYYTYEHHAVITDEFEADDTSDDLFYYADAYSENDTPSTSQLFIYFFEYGSVSGMNSSTATKVGDQFSTIYSRYTSSSFTSYRLITQLAGVGTKENTSYGINYTGITFADTSKAEVFNHNMQVLRLTIDEDADSLTEGDIFYGWFDEDWTVDPSTYSYPTED